MAIFELDWIEKGEMADHDRYVHKDRGTEIVEDAPGGMDGRMYQAILDEHQRVNSKCTNLAAEITQSWHPKERDLYTPEEFNRMGQELAERLAPGHLAWVVTHTEKAHIHNHITICNVNSETGKALENKRNLIWKGRRLNDEIARDRGLSVIPPVSKALIARVPDSVKDLVARGKKSWLFDMIGKAELARAYSTSFDEYVGTLNGLGVDVRVENKNISYLYGTNTKAVRGRSLGKNFDKEGLINAFEDNDERFRRNPGLRDRIRSDIGASTVGKGNRVGAKGDLLPKSASDRGHGETDYGRFTKVGRDNRRGELPAIFDERGGLLYQEMKKARDVSILDYCRANKIGITKNEKGETVLKGREFVVLEDKHWTNTKNYTKGTIVDFVALHDESNYLHALAKINGNPRLLLLESHVARTHRTYQSFYVPKPKEDRSHGPSSLRSLLKSKGYSGYDADSLFKGQGVHAGPNKSIWLMGEKSESAMEFREAPSGEWKQKRFGRPDGAFFERIDKGKDLYLFRDPFDFLLEKAKGRIPQGGSHFVLFDDASKGRLDEILALSPHISTIHIAASPRGGERDKERSLFSELKAKLTPFDIEIKEFSGQSKERARGPDIGF